jgi:hypothetical protein
VTTNVYVDGFNLYYRAVRGTPYKWLDIHKLCSLILPSNTIHRIRYFTAIVQDQGGDAGPRLRQQAYLRALRTTLGLTIHYGQFMTHAVRLPLVQPPPGGPRTAEVWRTEEKGSDVNLATYLLMDGFRQDCDVAVILSNDSDLELPIRFAQQELNVAVGILTPKGSPCATLRKAARFIREIRSGVLGASQFPVTLRDAHGIITKPATW